MLLFYEAVVVTAVVVTVCKNKNYIYCMNKRNEERKTRRTSENGA